MDAEATAAAPADCSSPVGCTVEALPTPLVECAAEEAEAASQVSAEPPAAPSATRAADECDDEPVRKCARVEVADDAATTSSQFAGSDDAVAAPVVVGA